MKHKIQSLKYKIQNTKEFGNLVFEFWALGFGYWAFVFLFFSLTFLQYIHAQSPLKPPQIDSLIAIVNKASHDTSRIKALNLLAKHYAFSKPEKGIEYAENALKLILNEPVMAISMKEEMASSYNSIAICRYFRGEHSIALEYYFKSLKILEEIKTALPGKKENIAAIGRIYANIGNIYGQEDELKKSLEYYFKALAVFDTLGVPAYSANAYINIGNVIKDMGKTARDADKISEAMDYYFKGIKIAEKINDKRIMASAYTNIGSLYSRIGNYPLALEYQRKALKLHKDVGNKRGQTYCHLALGEVLVNMHKPTDARRYLATADSLAREIGAQDMLAQIHEALSIADTTLAAAEPFKNAYWWQQAYRHHVRFKQIHDSIVNDENVKSLAKAETKYEYDKKLTIQKAERDKERLLAKEVSRRKNILIFSIILFLLITAGFAVYIFTRFRVISYQKNIIQNQNTVLEKANSEISAQKQIIQEKNKDITDSIHYASRIQRAILPSGEALKKFFPDSFVLCLPKDIVSGDFYFAAPPYPPEGGTFKIAKSMENPVKNSIKSPLGGDIGGLLLACCDCTGHGVPGALMSMIGNDLLAHIAGEKKNYDAGSVLDELDNRIRNILHSEESVDVRDGMDVSVIVYNQDKNLLNFAGANSPLLLVRGGEMTEIKPDRKGIGGWRTSASGFTNHSIPVRKNDIIYLFTDGILDQFGGPGSSAYGGKKFSKKHFKELLLSINGLDMNLQLKTLGEKINEWKGDFDQTDDITVIGIKV